MPSTEEIRATVEAYLAGVAGGTAADIAVLYAEDATVEDPVGSPVKNGRAEIEAFYATVAAAPQRATSLQRLRIAGDTAAFAFTVRITTPDGGMEFTPIDVMTFDEQARITSMRAIWGPQDMTAL
ncbi:nuclear transport factor 2 family protein [Blastococcus sp. SYSU D00820]